MKKSLVVLVAAAFVAGFAGGAIWGDRKIMTRERFRITRDIPIQVPPGVEGKLPAGAVLYEYEVLGETVLYYAFIGMKNRDVLAPDPGSGAVIKPISAFP